MPNTQSRTPRLVHASTEAAQLQIYLRQQKPSTLSFLGRLDSCYYVPWRCQISILVRRVQTDIGASRSSSESHLPTSLAISRVDATDPMCCMRISITPRTTCTSRNVFRISCVLPFASRNTRHCSLDAQTDSGNSTLANVLFRSVVQDGSVKLV